MHSRGSRLAAFAVIGLTLSTTIALAQGQEVPLDKQRGVRGRVVVAPDLFAAPIWPVTGDREKAVRSPALARRTLGRPVKPLLDWAPPLVVMLEGPGLRQEQLEAPVVSVEGMRFVPSSAVLPRAGTVKVQNKQSGPITIVDNSGAVLAKVAPGETADVSLTPGDRVLAVQEMPFARGTVKVLERGRILPVTKEGEIKLQDIPSGEYTLTFFLGAEPLRIQPLAIAEGGLSFIDASVSAKGVVDVTIKDAGLRVPVAQGGPPDAP